ncbi:MAG: hypothetical protein ACI8RD_009234 [Bacillariaceae sp.]|jgi:hypothetical protein
MILFESIIKSAHRCCPPTTANIGRPLLQDKIDRPYNGNDDVDDDDDDDDDDTENRCRQ